MVRMLMSPSVNGYQVLANNKNVGYLTAYEDKFQVYRKISKGYAYMGIMTQADAFQLFRAIYG
jgi:hypothetical protein